MKVFNAIVLTLLIVGCINWGLIGLFNFNLVEMIFGSSTLARIVYTIVGLAGIFSITFYGRERIED